MCWFPIYCGADGVIRVGGECGVQERDTSFTVWRLYCELDVGIHLVYVIKQDIHLVLLDNADHIYMSLPPSCENGDWCPSTPSIITSQV